MRLRLVADAATRRRRTPRRCHKLLQEQCRGDKVDDVGGRLRLGVVVASLAEAAPQYEVYLRR